MSDNPKEFSVEWWNSSIKKAIEWRRRYSSQNDWPRILEYYSHKFKNRLDPHFNLIFMLASSLVPNMVFQAPSIVNTPRRPEFMFWAQFFDSIDNWLIDECEIKDIMSEAVLIAFLMNTVGFHLGYDFPDNLKDLEKLEEMTFETPEGCIDRRRKTNQPWIDIVPPDKLIVAPGTRTTQNCAWIGKLLHMPTRYLKGLKSFKNVTATHEGIDKVTEFGVQPEYRAGEDYTYFYQIHDAVNKKVFCIDTAGTLIMGPVDDPLQVDGLPYEIVTFNEHPFNPWGVPDPIYVETQQLEGDNIRRLAYLQAKAAIIKAFVDSELMTEDMMDKFLTGDPMTMIPVNIPPEKKLSDILALVQPHTQMEFSQYLKDLLNDAQLIVGTGPNQLGTFAPGRRSKYEAQVVEERNLLRTGHRRQKVADVTEKLTGRMNQLIIKYWKAPVVQKVVGADAAIYWVKAPPTEFKEIKAQLVTKVNIESMIPVSSARKRGELTEILSLLSKFQGVNPYPIIQALLSSYPWLEASKMLPMANQGQVMDMGSFQSQQQKLLASPNLGQTAAANMGNITKLSSMYPTGGGAENG